ncbi:hypothetical protein GUJ93_ZPchr0013g34563 [Zizania palustris]|uniref:Uncharacterized protein n=1 Tax=Zizania palustris TaxID=103762 RepID=A0A8J6C1H9_ZIZPA|nr:hypothetical protein GUJ93_ZPchr0013g34563 [Zizania palustris]
MGNCIERSRGGDVVGADVDSVHYAAAKKKQAVHRQLVEVEEAAAAAAAKEEEVVVAEKLMRKGEKAPAMTEVKIRITRKQLEELLRRLEAAGKDGGGAISELLCTTSSCSFRHRPPQWRPSLQSIPE